MKNLLVLLLVIVAIAVPVIRAKQNGKHHDKGGNHHHHHKGDDDDDDDDDDRHEDYDALQKRLDLATSRLHHLDDELDERFDPDLRQKALALEYRVESLEEPNCDEHHYDCGAQDHECVSRLLVCDGVKDCRNGDDERHCNLPTKKGDHFEGEQVYENCSETLSEHFDFTITAVTIHDDYPVLPRIRATLHFTDESDEDDHEVALPTVGYYRYATHKLVLRAPQGHGLGLVCDFDGHNDDRCIGDIKSESTLTPCARYIFHRKDEDDEEEEEEHEEEDDDKKD